MSNVNKRPIIGWSGTWGICSYGRRFCSSEEKTTDHLMYYNDWYPIGRDRYYVYFLLEYSTYTIKQFAVCKEHWADLLLNRLKKEGVDGIQPTDSA